MIRNINILFILCGLLVLAKCRALHSTGDDHAHGVAEKLSSVSVADYSGIKGSGHVDSRNKKDGGTIVQVLSGRIGHLETLVNSEDQSLDKLDKSVGSDDNDDDLSQEEREIYKKKIAEMKKKTMKMGKDLKEIIKGVSAIVKKRQAQEKLKRKPPDPQVKTSLHESTILSTLRESMSTGQQVQPNHIQATDVESSASDDVGANLFDRKVDARSPLVQIPSVQYSKGNVKDEASYVPGSINVKKINDVLTESSHDLGDSLLDRKLDSRRPPVQVPSLQYSQGNGKEDASYEPGSISVKKINKDAEFIEYDENDETRPVRTAPIKPVHGVFTSWKLHGLDLVRKSQEYVTTNQNTVIVGLLCVLGLVMGFSGILYYSLCRDPQAQTNANSNNSHEPQNDALTMMEEGLLRKDKMRTLHPSIIGPTETGSNFLPKCELGKRLSYIPSVQGFPMDVIQFDNESELDDECYYFSDYRNGVDSVSESSEVDSYYNYNMGGTDARQCVSIPYGSQV